jgi:general secretion pathway protein M
MKLAKREKYLVSIAACVIGIFFVVQYLIAPFFEKREQLQKGIVSKQVGLAEIVQLSAEYKSLQKGSQGMEQLIARREKGFTLFTFLEKAAGEVGVKENIKYMKPSTSRGTGPYKESMVEMKLEGITLAQLAGYLHRVELPQKAVIIKRISVKENVREAGSLEAVLQAVTYE